MDGIWEMGVNWNEGTNLLRQLDHTRARWIAQTRTNSYCGPGHGALWSQAHSRKLVLLQRRRGAHGCRSTAPSRSRRRSPVAGRLSERQSLSHGRRAKPVKGRERIVCRTSGERLRTDIGQTDRSRKRTLWQDACNLQSSKAAGTHPRIGISILRECSRPCAYGYQSVEPRERESKLPEPPQVEYYQLRPLANSQCRNIVTSKRVIPGVCDTHNCSR